RDTVSHPAFWDLLCVPLCPLWLKPLAYPIPAIPCDYGDPGDSPHSGTPIRFSRFTNLGLPFRFLNSGFVFTRRRPASLSSYAFSSHFKASSLSPVWAYAEATSIAG